MLPVDPWLYVALGAGFVGGRLTPVRPRWIGSATLAVIFVLVALLGASLRPIAPEQLAATVPLALAVTGSVLLFTALIALALQTAGSRSSVRLGRPGRAGWLGPALLLTLLGGYAVGRTTGGSFDPGIDGALYVMLALVAFDLHWSRRGLGRLWVPLTAAVAGAAGAAATLTAAGLVPARVAFATTFGFGWYTLTGPLVAASAGATFGFLAFLANLLRENVTMVTSPYLGPPLGGEGLSALGGATSMDTTLYFITRFGDSEAASLALSTGLILTVAASVVVPLLLAGI